MMTPEKDDLDYFTWKRLQKLSTWNKWKKDGHKQLNSFEQQQMFNDPIVVALLSKDALILRLHWQYAAKKCGVQRSRLCCTGNKCTAHWLYEMASIWSPCVELPMQRLSLGIETKNDLRTDLRRRRSITVFAFI